MALLKTFCNIPKRSAPEGLSRTGSAYLGAEDPSVKAQAVEFHLFSTAKLHRSAAQRGGHMIRKTRIVNHPF